MTEPLQVGQFAIVDHEPVDRGPNAGVFHGKGPSDDRAELYLIAEGTTPAGEAFAGHIISAAGQAWSGLDMSLTGSIRKLFAEAERNLQDWNGRSIAHHRVQLGMACLGRRGTQSVIAQAGPSVVFHRSVSALNIYTADGDHALPLGGAACEPQLRRINFAPGDRLLFLSTKALDGLDDDLLAGILGLAPDRILPEIYRRVADLRHVTVLLVSAPVERRAARGRPAPEMVIGESMPGREMPALAAATVSAPATAADDEVAPGADPFQPSLFIDDPDRTVVDAAKRQLIDISARARQAAAVPTMSAEAPRPLQRAVGDDSLARLAAEHHASATLAQSALEAHTAVLHPARGAWRTHTSAANEHSPGDARRRHQRHSFTRSLVRGEGPPVLEPLSEDAPLANELADEARARATVMTPVSEAIAGENASVINSGGSLVRVRGSMSGRWRGGGSLSRRRTAQAAQLPPTWLVIVVGLGILLTLVGFITVPRILDEQQGDRYAELVDQAQQRIATSRAVQDPSERRKALTEAQAALLEAAELQPGSADAKRLSEDVRAALTVLDAVKQPAAVQAIGSLEQFGEKPVAITRLAVSIDTAYLLDTTSGQVIAMALASGERKVVFGEDKEAKRGRPLAITYLENTDLGAPTLLVLDSGKTLWSITASQAPRAIPFASPPSMTVTDISVFGSELFVLDANDAKIFRFTPADGGFGAQPVRVLDNPDLAAAKRLSAMADQELVTADANGQIHRFAGQLALALGESGIDKRLSSAEVPMSLSRSGELAVLDAANDRIVVLRSDGAFDRQYRSPDFKAMSAFTMRNGVGYVFSGGKLRKVTF